MRVTFERYDLDQYVAEAATGTTNDCWGTQALDAAFRRWCELGPGDELAHDWPSTTPIS